MSSTNPTQTTLTDFPTREYDLAWTPDNPNRGATRPALHWPTVKRYNENSEQLPYEVPTYAVSAGLSRMKHRTYYWLVNDFHQFECPDCGRTPEEVLGVHVHHRDENPFNGCLENLVALCQRCHKWRHGSGPSLNAMTVEEWSATFTNELLNGGND